jgi:hypothetical protein
MPNMRDKKEEEIEPIYLGDSFEEAICRLVRVDKKEKKRKEKNLIIEKKRENVKSYKQSVNKRQ